MRAARTLLFWVTLVATTLAFLFGPRLSPVGAATIFPAPATSPFPAGCIYRASPTTLADGTQTTILCDSHGNQIGAGNATAPVGLPVSATQYARTGTTGSIASGGVAQNWATAGAIAHGCLIMNTSSQVENIRMDGGAASATSLQLYPNGGYYECPATAGPSGAASIFGSTTGQTYYDEVW